LGAFESIVNALNPDNVLKRGYSITLHKGKLIDHTTQLKEGDLLETKNEYLDIESRWIKSSPRKKDKHNK
jgi:exodeoxyribonuclease VII large subunit